MKNELTVPVLLCIFTRLDTAKQVFQRIREAKPQKLYLVSDGPRKNIANEYEKVCGVRKYIEEHVDWNCEIIKDYATENMGCGRRIYSGITNVFLKEDKAIILEDDCVPDSGFFRYCQEMLEYYKDSDDVMMVSGNNPISNLYSSKQDYFFSKIPFAWGWATWRRAWERYDYAMNSWPKNRKNPIFKKIFPIKAYWYFTSQFDVLYSGKYNDIWDYQLLYAIIINNMFGILPAKNHVCNIGFQEDSTHTTAIPEWNNNISEPVNFPIKFREDIEWEQEFDKCYLQYAGEHGISTKIKHILGVDINQSIFNIFKRK